MINSTSPTTKERFKSLLFKILGPHAVHAVRARLSSRQLDEVDLVYNYFVSRGGSSRLLVDVGAHYGTSLSRFAADGWRVHAFEPDDHNRAILRMRHGHRTNLTINDQAVSDEADIEVPFYRSNVSSGISGLSAFHASHSESQGVSLTTLDKYCADAVIDHIDFLKIDTEGHDLLVLKGLDFEARRPEVVICEFEDIKTKPRGYDRHDLANYLASRRYHLVISEWYPIQNYGQRHRWKAFRECMTETDDKSWGNVIAFTEEVPRSCLSVSSQNSKSNRVSIAPSQ